ncbi:MAG: hypothetical protein KAT43_05120 [Nanoarchaeota archaeon]|nr:hypothetical protein [Nanoarchaeota archaeon]
MNYEQTYMQMYESAEKVAFSESVRKKKLQDWTESEIERIITELEQRPSQELVCWVGPHGIGPYDPIKVLDYTYGRKNELEHNQEEMKRLKRRGVRTNRWAYQIHSTSDLRMLREVLRLRRTATINPIHILLRALKDPILEGIDCICPSNYPKLAITLVNLSSDTFISEWRYGIGEIKYECHVHRNGIGEQIKRAFENGVRGGGSRKLTSVRSKEELDVLIQQS